MNNDYIYCDLVRITPEAYSSCLNHSLLTDQEEIMGLLIGNQCNKDFKNIINIFATICQNRKCKTKDRVELDEIQLVQASKITEELEKENKIKANVVGWYHSHPKITIPPSNVDLETQKSQQYQGAFVGLIFSCFSSDAKDVNRINMTAFQSKKEEMNLKPHYIDIEFANEIELLGNTWSNISNTAMTYSSILKNLLEEEEEQYTKEKTLIDDDDKINNILLLSSRQSLLCKIIQNVSTPYVNCLNSEIENMKNYLQYIKELNNKLKKSIRGYEEINQFNN